MMDSRTRSILLSSARAAVEAALAGSAPPSRVDDVAELRAKRGAFVSVHVGEELRGCIGSVFPGSALIDTVMSCAVSAATGDPRFPALCSDELPRATFEISVLSPPVPMERPDEIVIGVHGLIIAYRGRSGLLLPQVATRHGMTAEQFLEAVCLKAGLPAGTWRHKGVRLQRFTAEVFGEAPAAP